MHYVLLQLIVFVYNKGTREDFEADNVKNMLLTTSILFQHSRLKIKCKFPHNVFLIFVSLPW